jgi:hypothetical protein
VPYYYCSLGQRGGDTAIINFPTQHEKWFHKIEEGCLLSKVKLPMG